jgi:hypothetical protein
MVFTNSIPLGEEHLHTRDSTCNCEPEVVFTEDGDMYFRHNQLCKAQEPIPPKEDTLSFDAYLCVALAGLITLGVFMAWAFVTILFGISAETTILFLVGGLSFYCGVIGGCWLKSKP